MKYIHRSYSLSAHQRDHLDDMAFKLGISASEYLRRVVDRDRCCPVFKLPSNTETFDHHAHGNS